MFKKLSLKAKLTVLSVTFITGLSVINAIAYFALNRVSKDYQHIAEVNLRKTRILASMRGAAKDVTRNVIRLSLLGSSKQETESVVAKLDKLEKAYLASQETYLSLPQEDGEKELSQALLDAANKFFEAGHKTIAQSIKEGEAERVAALQTLNTEYRHAYDDIMFPTLNKLVDFQDENSEMRVASASKLTHSSNILLLSLGGLIALLSFGLSQALSSYLAATLRKVAGLLSAESKRVATASQELSSASSELSSMSTQQAASVQETSATIEEMSAMITKTAENTSSSKDLTESCRDSANKGKNAVSVMLRSMTTITESNEAIKSQIENNNQDLSAIVKVISEIGDKTKVIHDIVFQTKLLSFNASVEAARAGEHGKGFAVVAEEVGNLAQMSGNAAKEITSLLNESTKKVQEIVSASKSKIEHLMDSAHARVNEGTQVAQECSSSLDEVSQKITELSRMINEIASASAEQSTGVKEVNTTIAQLNQAIQTNNSVAADCSSAVHRLSTQAQDLAGLVGDLVKVVEGAASRTNTHGHNSPLHEEEQLQSQSDAELPLAS